MIKRLVVWGGMSGDLDSARHVFRHYHENARKLGIETVWCNDRLASRMLLAPGTTVLAVDRWQEHIAPAVEGVDYVLHNFDGAHPLCRDLEHTPERLLRLQVYTNNSTGEKWDDFRLFDRPGRVLFQPWGSDLLPEEFLEPVFNPGSRDLTFVGAIWRDLYEGQDLGNQAMISELRALCADRGLTFRHLTHVSDAENVAAIREARVAPAFAGGWQVRNNYLPCRVFKAAAYGTLALTNVTALAELLRIPVASIGDLLDDALRMKRQQWVELVREQQQAIVPYTYRANLEAISRAFEEIRG